MICKIKNDKMTVGINETGAELWSLIHENKEMLWQGDETYWKSRSPVLFPFVGRSFEGKYKYKNEVYEIGNHGFVRGELFKIIMSKEDEITFSYKNDKKNIYPFDFTLTVTYKLEDELLKVTHKVMNNGDENMYFGIGAHPGFKVPFEENVNFEDYKLKMSSSTINRLNVSEDGFMLGTKKVETLEENLYHEMFEGDAVLFESNGCEVSIVGKEKTIEFTSKDAKYMALWHTPKTKAEFICIEPWCSLPAKQGKIENIELDGNKIELSPNETFVFEWQVKFINH